MSADHHDGAIPTWTWIAPLAAAALVVLNALGIITAKSIIAQVVAAALLGAAVFAAVHHAEVLALRLGEPFGSILLAVAVTVIEVALIVSIMTSGTPGSADVARDTIFATVMIVLNGVVGLSLVFGGSRHFEQVFQLQGASSGLAVLGTLATVTLVLPNYTVSEAGPFYSQFQLLFVAAMSLALWCIFVFVQTVKHRDYFIDPNVAEQDENHEPPSDRLSLISLALLLVSLAAVVLLAKMLTYALDSLINAAGLPRTFIGVVIAGIVLLPEGMAAVKSALANRLQNSINLSTGSAIASIGLTIPAVACVALLMSQTITLGISPANTVLLVLTMFISTLTLGTGRTTVLHGAIHLVIFAIFLLIAAVP